MAFPCRLSRASCALPRNSSVIPARRMAEPAATAKGTRPEGAQTEADASRKVRAMFTEIAPRYDFLNHLLSLQLDRLWRARTARRLRPIMQRRDARVLDLCCGTGDLAFELVRSARAILGARIQICLYRPASSRRMLCSSPSPMPRLIWSRPRSVFAISPIMKTDCERFGAC